MKKLLLAFVLANLFSLAQVNQMNTEDYNFFSFRERKKIITSDLLKLTPQEFHNHPDFGVSPKNAPTAPFIELIHKRKDSTRYYVNVNNQTEIAVQQAYGALHFRDNNNYLRELDFSLYPENTGIYTTLYQPNKIKIDSNQKSMSLIFGNSSLLFSKNMSLIYEDANHTKTVLAYANWNKLTVGADGFYITDFFPDVDYYGLVGENSIKTNFKIKSNITANYSGGYLIVSDQLQSELTAQYIPSTTPDSDNKFIGDITIINTNGSNYKIQQGICFDNSRTNTQALYYKKNSLEFEMLVDLNWLNSNSIEYPIIVDPTISTNGSLAQASCSQSMYNASCTFANSCNYNLTVATPANTTITDIQWSFNYRATGACWRQDGAVRFTYLGCISPGGAGLYWFCNITSAGNCNGTNIPIFSDFSSCIPAPSCAPYNMNFTMQFFRSCIGSGGCSTNCIRSDSPWTMTILGKTLETLADNTTGHGTQNLSVSCLGNTTLNPAQANGVGGYNYLWSPGGQTTSTKTISNFFVGSQLHTCQVTDACGTVRTATFNVTSNCVLPIELLSFDAEEVNRKVNLIWETATENNASHFVIERSSDAINFDYVGEVKASGNSTLKKTYQLLDTEVELNTTMYYKLRQFDLNNPSEKFSKIIAIEPNQVREIEVYPNPNNGIFTINFTGDFIDSNYQLDIYDSFGRLVLSKNDLKGNYKLDLIKYSSGIYSINIKLNGKFYTKNVIKQ